MVMIPMLFRNHQESCDNKINMNHNYYNVVFEGMSTTVEHLDHKNIVSAGIINSVHNKYAT